MSSSEEQGNHEKINQARSAPVYDMPTPHLIGVAYWGLATTIHCGQDFLWVVRCTGYELVLKLVSGRC